MASPTAPNDPPTITATASGDGTSCTFIGTRQPSSDRYPKAVDVFYGIPYATARRFHPAEAKKLTEAGGGTGWAAVAGRFDASRVAPSQPYALARQATAENPLTLNIFRPAGAGAAQGEDQPLLPVVVYVHGGGFNFGHPLERDLASFVSWAKEDVIVVAITYRLGALGFLAGGPEVTELNLGLRDQRVAVEWVKRWIGEFGGNGEDLTMMGVSAGAHSTGHHILHPSPLPFHKAILESGSATARSVLSPSHPRPTAQFRDLNLYSSNKPLATLPVDSLTQSSVGVWANHITTVTWPFQPVIDGPGGVIPDLPLSLWDGFVRSGRGPSVAVITGFCSHEGTLFAPQRASTSAEFRSFFSSLIPSFSSSDLDALELLYPDPLIHPDSPYRQPPGIGGPQKRPYGAQFRRIHEAYAHYAYICPVLHTAHILSKAGARVYVYEYAALGEPFRAANHEDQASPVVHDMAALDGLPGLAAVADQMNRRWTSFAASPNGALDQSDEQEAWPIFRSPFNDDGSVTTPSPGVEGIGELLVFGEGNDEAAGGMNQGTPVKTRGLTAKELEQCRFWWERMELSQGMGERGTALLSSQT